MRADRLLSLLLLLQKKELCSAHELALALEVSERTIYRDIDALSRSGVPVYAQAGRNGGFGLVESYRTDLTGLSETETRALYLALLAHNVPQPLAELGIRGDLERALLKLSAALPQRFRMDEQRARQRLVLDPSGWEFDSETPNLQPIQQAVWADQLLHIGFRTVSGVIREQEVEPYGLVAKAGVWYLVYARKGHFQVIRLTNLLTVRLLEGNFSRRPGFDLPAFWHGWIVERLEQAPRFEVVVRVTAAFVPQLAYHFGSRILDELEHPGPEDEQGRRVFCVRFENFEEARTRLSGFGRAVEVLEPPELRVVLVDYARQVLDLYEA